MARAMKDSGVEWIGEIPEGWKIIRNKRVMRREKEICQSWQGEPVLSLTLNGIIERDLDNPSGKMPTTFDGYQYIRKGGLLLCLFDIDVTPRCVGLILQDGVTSPAYSHFRLQEGYHAPYYYYYYLMLDYSKELLHLAKNIRHSFTESQLGEISVIAPSYEEQQRIADFLDKQAADIDASIAKTQESIEEYKKLKQAVITQAVTKGVRPGRVMKDSGVEWMGDIPEEWYITKVKYVSMIMPSCDFGSITEGSDVAFAPMECIKQGYALPLTIKYEKRLSSYTPFAEGDIVMAKVTPCYENGNIAIMSNLPQGVGLGSSELITMRPHSIDSQFFMYLLQNEEMKQRGVATMTGTGGLKRISPQWLKNQILAVPTDIAEQQEIVAYLDEKCAAIDTLIEKKQAIITELEAYKKSLIYEYVTGKKEVPVASC